LFFALAIFFSLFLAFLKKQHTTRRLSAVKKRESKRERERERGSFVGSSEIPSSATSRDHCCPQDFEINRFNGVSSIVCCCALS
jgi:hypothetical protein